MLDNKSVVAIIPARGGSKGVPRKNLRCVHGKSLLERTIESAKLSKLIDRIIVSSEDEEIIAAAKVAGIEVPFVRPMHLAQDETSGIEPILHALENLPHFDYVVVLQVTSPLRTNYDIDRCLQLCKQKNARACVSVTISEVSPHWLFALNGQDELKPVISDDLPTRRQELSSTYQLNGALYVAETGWFTQTKRFVTPETIAYIMPKERSLDIDTEDDLKRFATYIHNTAQLMHDN